MDDIIAEKEIFSISPEGEKVSIHIAIGRPYRVDDVSWACPVIAEGLHNKKKLRDTVGIDSWQAQSLALALVRQLLDFYVKDGGRLFWEEGGEEIPLNDLFPSMRPRETDDT